MNVEELMELAGELAEQDREVGQLLIDLEKAHGTQLYGWRPYVYHLLHTCQIGMGYGFDTRTWILIFLLHDSVEDTDITLEWIESRYGAQVAAVVDAVTGCNGDRKQHCAVQHAKINALPRAAIAKTCDRMSHWLNLTEHFDEDPDKYTRLLRMYESEADEFEAMVMGKIPSEMLTDLKDMRAEAMELLPA